MNFLHGTPLSLSAYYPWKARKILPLRKYFKNTVLSESCIHLKIGSENLSLKTIFLKENTKNEIH